MSESEPLPEGAFKALMGRRPNEDERQRLTKVRIALGIRSSDAIWEVMIALDYHLQLYTAIPDKIGSETRKAVDDLRKLVAGQRGGRRHAPGVSERATHWFRHRSARGGERGRVRRYLRRGRIPHGGARTPAVGGTGAAGRGPGRSRGLADVRAAPAGGGALGASRVAGGALAAGSSRAGGRLGAAGRRAWAGRCGAGGSCGRPAPVGMEGSSGAWGRGVGGSPSKTLDRSGG